jgi:hypothetical protein
MYLKAVSTFWGVFYSPNTIWYQFLSVFLLLYLNNETSNFQITENYFLQFWTQEVQDQDAGSFSV